MHAAHRLGRIGRVGDAVVSEDVDELDVEQTRIATDDLGAHACDLDDRRAVTGERD